MIAICSRDSLRCCVPSGLGWFIGIVTQGDVRLRKNFGELCPGLLCYRPFGPPNVPKEAGTESDRKVNRSHAAERSNRRP